MAGLPDHNVLLPLWVAEKRLPLAWPLFGLFLRSVDPGALSTALVGVETETSCLPVLSESQGQPPPWPVLELLPHPGQQGTVPLD